MSINKDYVDLPDEEFNLLDNVIPIDVCHYTSRKTGLEKILKTRKIRFSKLIYTNDPLESKSRMYSDDTWRTDKGFWYKLGERLENKLMAEWKVLSFSCHKDPLKYSFMNTDYRRLYTYDHNKFGVGYSTMWAHYGEEHKGMCMLFSGKELDNNIKNSLLQENCIIKHGFVRYDDEKSFRPIKRSDTEYEGYEIEEKIRKSLIKNYKDNFLRKSTEWKSEHEFRWLIQSKNSNDLLIPIEGAIRGVVLGEDFSRSHIKYARKLCFSLGIPVGTINWVSGKPQINFFVGAP